jgi:predicted DNA-binding protein (UPF0251 family)
MSPRKKKHRNCVCPLREKLGLVFKPAGTPLVDMEIITIEHDELEALFLCDGEDLNQERAGEKMGVSRGTVQRLLTQGRKKVIGALVGQKALVVGGVQTPRNATEISGEGLAGNETD